MKFRAAFGCALALLALDLWTKNWAHRRLQYQDVEIIPNFFRLSLVHNSGIAFGLLDDPSGAGPVKPLVLIAVGATALVIVTLYALRMPPGARLAQLAVGCLLGGILGNMVDRILRSYVVDFLEFNLYFFKFPTFNVADAAITVGAALLLLVGLRAEGSRSSAGVQGD